MAACRWRATTACCVLLMCPGRWRARTAARPASITGSTWSPVRPWWSWSSNVSRRRGCFCQCVNVWSVYVVSSLWSVLVSLFIQCCPLQPKGHFLCVSCACTCPSEHAQNINLTTSTTAYTETFTASQEMFKNGLMTNYQAANLFPLAFILYSFMEIECILKSLLSFIWNLGTFSPAKMDRKSIKVILRCCAGDMLTIHYPDIKAIASSGPSLQRGVHWPVLPTGHHHPCCHFAAAAYSG